MNGYSLRARIMGPSMASGHAEKGKKSSESAIKIAVQGTRLASRHAEGDEGVHISFRE